MKEKLGLKAKDKITGFSGIVVAYDEWLNGCVRVGIQPESLDKEGQPQKQGWFDLVQVEFLGSGLTTEPLGGGPRPSKSNPCER